MEKKGTNEVVIQISEMSNSSQASSIESTNFNEQSSTRPPQLPTSESITRRRSLTRSKFSKPKSRLVEPTYHIDAILREEETNELSTSPNDDVLESGAVSPKTPPMGSPAPEEDEDGDEDEEIYQHLTRRGRKKNGKKWGVMWCFELTMFMCIMVLLISSFTIKRLVDSMIWGFALWKWCVLVLITFCGRLCTNWFINLLALWIQSKFLLRRKKMLVFFGLKRSVHVALWLGLILLAWILLFKRGRKRSRHTTKILNYVTRALASSLIGPALWLLKNLCIKLLESSVELSRYYDRIHESFNQNYVLGILTDSLLSKKKKEEEIDVEKVKRMRDNKVCGGITNCLFGSIRDLGLDLGLKNNRITSEWEARVVARQIIKNVAKPGNNFIEEEDLMCLMEKNMVDDFILSIEGGTEIRKINQSALRNWLVKIYNEQQSLTHSLEDTYSAIKKLDKLVSVITGVVIVLVWLLVMGLLTTQLLVFISSQLVLLVFVFGNTAKTVFESVIFVFMTHPFDVGDKCVIDGVEMVVETINLSTTVFLKYDNEKILYPNSLLATKPISNFYRSPQMGDSVEFTIDVSTSVETIGKLKARIKAYLESKPQHWLRNHTVQAKGIENKIKMVLYVTHTINFQNPDRGNRRSDLVLEMKKFFDQLGIQYNLS